VHIIAPQKTLIIAPQKTLIIGIDVAKDDLVMVARNADATFRTTRTVANDKRGFAALARWTRMLARQQHLTTIHAGLEATGMGYRRRQASSSSAVHPISSTMPSEGLNM
jgi:hypothetical protein